MALYPLQVEIDEKAVSKLRNIFLIAQRKIEKDILNFATTDYTRAQRREVLTQVESTISELAEKTGKTLQKELPLYYESGVRDAVKQLKNIKAPIPVEGNLNRLHKQAISALLDETAKLFAEGMTGVTRSAEKAISKATRQMITQKLAEGAIVGQTRKTVTKEIKKVIQDEGIYALIDRGGRKWTLDRYSEMLFRTKAVEARNRGMGNRMLENNYDLVQVSNHNASHDACRRWEGRILSLTGSTEGYPTLEEAESSGLFHPNCKHAVNAIIPSLARKTEAYNPDERTRVISKSEIEKSTQLERGNLPNLT
jgi:hypothetical protein